MSRTSPSLGPISPELALVDPELRAWAQSMLPEPGALVRAAAARRASIPADEPPARAVERERSSRLAVRMLALAGVAAAGAVGAVGAGGFPDQRPLLVPQPETVAVARSAAAPVPDEVDRYRAAPTKEVQPQQPRSSVAMGAQRPPAAVATKRAKAVPAAVKKAKPAPAASKQAKAAPARARIAVTTRSLRRPAMTWKPVPGASYYNLIIWRDGARVLDLWPAQPRVLLPTSWHYRGKSRKLEPGSYFWFAYPGFGPRAEGRYGAPVQSGILVIERK